MAHQIICQHCGKSFPVKPSHAATRKHCSHVCHSAAKKGKVPLVCLHCKRPFAAWPSNARRYCSHPCYVQAQFKPPAERFERFISRSDEPDGCWKWTGATNGTGYGSFGFRHGDDRLAHRVAYELIYGPIPPGLFVLHRCDNTLCVRPDHLFLGTHQDNIDDMVRKRRHYCRPKVAVQDIHAIRSSTESAADLAARYGVHLVTIQRIRDRVTWKRVLP